jgi:3-dehydroquinate synthase
MNVHVNASRPYDVVIREGLLEACAPVISPYVQGRTAAVVTDDNVAPLYLQTLTGQLKACGCRVVCYEIPNGEASKTLETYGRLLVWLSQQGLTRGDCVIALGGGVVGDLAGFAAATYLRGIAYVQVPTTLLAAVDSSVGGKTAVDLPTGKNLAGAFYPPALVLCDPLTLRTLPAQVFADGMAEVIKYGMICDAPLLALLERGMQGQQSAIIGRCVAIKRDIVSRDERETGERKLLNFGHTVAHAVEKCSNYTVSHGRAVGIGRAVLTRSWEQRGLCPPECTDALLRLLGQYGLDDTCRYDAAALCAAMGADKKRDGDSIDLIVPTGLGKTAICRTPVAQLPGIVAAGLA